MTILSSKHGKALEASVIKALMALLPQAKLSSYTTHFIQSADTFCEGISDKKMQDIELYSKIIAPWLIEEYKLSTKPVITIHRLKDGEGAKGDVTDIKILHDNNEEINISLKHNHAALKHPRPPSLAQWIGIQKKEQPDKYYRNSLSSIIDDFLSAAKRINPNAKKFSEIKDANSQMINEMLYKPIYELVLDFLTQHQDVAHHAKSLFRFLVGTNHTKIVCKNGKVVAYHFNDIKEPSSFITTFNEGEYLTITFSNEWRVFLRLHTASSKLGRSIKFDVQLDEGSSAILPIPILG